MTLVCILLAACSGGAPAEEAETSDAPSRSERDSILGASSLPGAGAVQRALDASEAAAERAARFDSLQRP